eukprot:TRINITY_DN13661_c0_g2_i1.p1 TRINITY_DN13661_c0_g2~~TRINITY_DN13661_c0_g2_i1.p1  ORF type:complete len:314 (+),score=50.90 TRINITY_DN13661_c0_g2_i1:410-1351(+)
MECKTEGSNATEISSSAPSSNPTSALHPMDLVTVRPVIRDENEVREDLCSMAQMAKRLHGSNAAQAADTFQLIFDIMVSEPGGAIAVVGQKEDFASSDDSDGLVFEVLDGGLFLKVLRRFSANILEQRETFTALMRAFRRHTATDKWEAWLLKELGDDLAFETNDSGVPQGLGRLNGQPKDGALVLGLQGTVLAAVAKLRHNGSFHLVKEDGAGAGTRHAGGLGVAEWMGQRGICGIVFVASDSGTVSVMLPCGLEAPRVLQVVNSKPSLLQRRHVSWIESCFCSIIHPILNLFAFHGLSLFACLIGYCVRSL